jgi:hypothetical protein
VTYDQLVEGLRASTYEMQREGMEVRAGLKQEQNLAEIVERYAWLFSDEALSVAIDAEASATPDDRESRRRVRIAIVQGLIDRRTAAAEDKLTTLYATSTVELPDGGRLPFFSAQSSLVRQPDPRLREQIGDGCAAVMESADDLALTVMASTLDVLRDLGQESYTAFWSETKRVDYAALSAELTRVVDASADVYRRRVGGWMELAGRGFGDCPWWHSSHFRSLPEHAARYSAARFEPAMRETFRRLGLDLFHLPTVTLDLADRPAKNPRASVWVPAAGVEVHLLTRPQGGYLDYAAFLHESGHALHFGLSDPAIGWPLTNLGSMAYAELWSFLIESIGQDPRWLAQALQVEDSVAEAIASDVGAVQLMMFVRLAAKFAYELALYAGDPLEVRRGRELYARILGERTGFRYDPRAWQFDRDAAFYSADYLRALLASTALRERLDDMFGSPWWSHAETGRWLSDQWRRGWVREAEQLVIEVGGEPRSGDALLRVFRERLPA